MLAWSFLLGFFLDVRQVFLLKSYAEQRRRADRVQFRFRPIFHLFSLSMHVAVVGWYSNTFLLLPVTRRLPIFPLHFFIFGALVPRLPSMCVKFSRTFHQSTPQPPPHFHANLLTWIFWKIYGEFDAPKGECKSSTSGSPRSIRWCAGAAKRLAVGGISDDVLRTIAKIKCKTLLWADILCVC